MSQRLGSLNMFLHLTLLRKFVLKEFSITCNITKHWFESPSWHRWFFNKSLVPVNEFILNFGYIESKTFCNIYKRRCWGKTLGNVLSAMSRLKISDPKLYDIYVETRLDVHFSSLTERAQRRCSQTISRSYNMDNLIFPAGLE